MGMNIKKRKSDDVDDLCDNLQDNIQLMNRICLDDRV